MAILPIRLFPDPVLREATTDVAEVDDSVRKLIADMAETMRAAPGVGLAAPQVGVQRRVLVYSLGTEEPLRALVNARILERSGSVIGDEGCLSIPELSYPVERAERVIVTALDPDGEPITYEASDFEARVIQHEVDHLDGVLFLDRIDPDLRREAMRILRARAFDAPLRMVARTPSSSM